MFLIKEGMPEEGELVLCTVTNIQFHSIFVKLDEYSKSGMIHISEISAGRIRNIRDFVKEGKKVVCVVLRINRERGHIDLSLRRVNENQKRNKVNEIKQEQKCEKIIEMIAKNNDIDAKKFYFDIKNKISSKYLSLHPCFEDIVAGNYDIGKLELDENITKQLDELIRARIKEAEVEIGGDLKLVTYDFKGIEIIKEALKKAKVNDNVGIVYKSAGCYKIKIKASDYKKAEKLLDKAINNAMNVIDKNNGEGEFVRQE